MNSNDAFRTRTLPGRTTPRTAAPINKPPLAVTGSGLTKMRVVRARSFEPDGTFKQAWNHLADNLPVFTVFQRPEWLEAWWAGNDCDPEIYILAVYCSGRLVGVAPWMVTSGRLAGKKIKRLCVLGDDFAGACPWLAEPLLETEVLQAILQYLLAHPADWDLLALRSLLPSARDALEAVLNGRRCFWHAWQAGRLYNLSLEKTGWESYFQALPAETKSLFLHQEQFLKRVKSARLSGSNLTPDILEQVLALNQQASPGGRTVDRHVSPGRGRLAERILRSSLRESAWLALYYLKDELICYSCGFALQGSLVECDFNVVPAFCNFSLDQYASLKNIAYAMDAGYKSLGILNTGFPTARGFNLKPQQTHDLLIYHAWGFKVVSLAQRGFKQTLAHPIARWFGFLERQLRRPAHYLQYLQSQSTAQHISILRYVWRNFKKTSAWMFCTVDHFHMVCPIKNLILPALPPLPPGLVIRELTLEDYSLMEMMAPRKDLPARISRFWEADRCWGAVLRDRVIGYIWLTNHDHFEMNSKIRLKIRPEEIYLYDAGVTPAYKHKGIMYFILNGLITRYLKGQERMLTALVLVSNHIPLKIFLRYNFLPNEIFRMRRWFGITWQIWKSVPESLLRALPAMRKAPGGRDSTAEESRNGQGRLSAG